MLVSNSIGVNPLELSLATTPVIGPFDEVKAWSGFMPLLDCDAGSTRSPDDHPCKGRGDLLAVVKSDVREGLPQAGVDFPAPRRCGPGHS